MELIILSGIILFNILLIFLKDKNKKRKKMMTLLILGNLLFFLSPLLLAFFNTPFGDNILSANSGGAFLYLYMIVLPVSFMVQVSVIVLKIIYFSEI